MNTEEYLRSIPNWLWAYVSFILVAFVVALVGFLRDRSLLRQSTDAVIAPLDALGPSTDVDRRDGRTLGAVDAWRTAGDRAPQTISLERIGNTYTLRWNGVELFSVTRKLGAQPRVGLHTYGRVALDDFKLYALP